MAGKLEAYGVSIMQFGISLLVTYQDGLKFVNLRPASKPPLGFWRQWLYAEEALVKLQASRGTSSILYQWEDGQGKHTPDTFYKMVEGWMVFFPCKMRS